MVEGSQITVDDSGMYGGRFVATKEGFAVVAMEATDEGVTVAGLAATTKEEGEGTEEKEGGEEKKPGSSA